MLNHISDIFTQNNNIIVKITVSLISPGDVTSPSLICIWSTRKQRAPFKTNNQTEQAKNNLDNKEFHSAKS